MKGVERGIVPRASLASMVPTPHTSPSLDSPDGRRDSTPRQKPVGESKGGLTRVKCVRHSTGNPVEPSQTQNAY